MAGEDTEMQAPHELSRWPSGGNRRILEERWLDYLERHGLPQRIVEQPSKPLELRQAIEEFNSGAFWHCHETLEELWLNTPYPLRFFYHSIIKTAVGFHHVGHHNRHGSRVKLADSVRLLRLFQPAFMGVRTEELLREIVEWVARVDHAEQVHWQELDDLPRPTIATVG